MVCKNKRKTTNINESQKNEKATKAGAVAAFNVRCIMVRKRKSTPDGNRTRTRISADRILSPARLPVPPPGYTFKKIPPTFTPGEEDPPSPATTGFSG
jgi:hypothetical protein